MTNYAEIVIYYNRGVTMEYLDLYDKDNKTTGEIVLRTHDKVNVPKDRYIKVVIIFMQNSEGNFLLQLTSKEKGSVIATTGGHVKSGQSSLDAIYAEVNEELGLDISNEDIRYIGTYFKTYAIVDTYYMKKDININDIILQKEEVDSVNWYSINEIKELIEHEKFRVGNIDGFNIILKYLESK